MRNQRIILLCLFLTIFIDVLGYGLVIPVLTPLFRDPVQGIFSVDVSAYWRNVALGALLASFPLAQFFGAPILGSLADRHGRRKMLLFSLVGTFVGYTLFSIGIWQQQLFLLYLGRIIAGFMGGNIAITLSMISDITQTDEGKTRRFGMIGVAVALGVIIGPFLGGILSHREYSPLFSFTTPFVLAAVLSFINILVAYFVLPETLKKSINVVTNIFAAPRHVISAFSNGSLKIVYLMIFLQTLGFNFFAQFFSVYLYEEFGITELQTGFLFAYTGFWLAFSQGIAVRYIVEKVRIDKVIRISLFMLAFTYLALLIPEKLIWFYVVLPMIALFHGFVLPNTTTLISSGSSDKEQGEMLGIYQSVQALAQVFPPVIAGFIATINADLPIVAAGVCTLVSWGVFQTYKYKLDHSQH